MEYKRKFSLFISSTYEDLKEERQALFSVALENDFIPVGMEQFHSAPIDQWSLITKMIDECDFYLLVIGGRYGSIDEETGISYTEKEYNYSKKKGIPVLVMIKNPSSITADKTDDGDDKYDKAKKLDDFRNKVQTDGNTVDFFDNLDNLCYAASTTLSHADKYVNEDAGWIRYIDMVDICNDKINHTSNNNTPITKEDIDKLFDIENETLILNDVSTNNIPIVGKDNIENIPIDSAFLLVYAAEDDGRIFKMYSIDSPTIVSTANKQFMVNMTRKESAKWVEALDRLIIWGWVKDVGNKGNIFELTGTGYEKAELLKEGMNIDTNKNPLEEIKEFNSQ